MQFLPRRFRAILATLACVAIVTAVACGGGTSSKDKTATAAAKGGASTPAASATKATAAKIDISAVDELKDGSLDIGSDIAYAPVEFFDANNKAVGLDVDVANGVLRTTKWRKAGDHPQPDRPSALRHRPA